MTRQQAESLAAKIPPLQVAANRVAATVRQGMHGRRRAGQGETFWQFRDYQTFDSTRAIDWRQSAKSRQIFVREREWEAAQSVWIWRDGSPSMRWQSERTLPEKAERAEVLALALARLLIDGGENIAVLGEGLRARGGRTAMGPFAETLARQPAEAVSLPPFERLPRHAVCVMFGDFLDPLSELRPLVAQYASDNVRGHIVQIMDPAEEAFPFRGRIRFEGLENERAHLLRRADTVRDDYVDRLARHRAGLQDVARNTGWTFQHHTTDQSPESALLHLWLTLSNEDGRTGGLGARGVR